MIGPSRVCVAFRQCLTCTTFLVILALCSACNSIQAQNDDSEIPPPTEAVSSNSVVSLGKLIPEGDIIKISVANAEDSRVNTILVKEGDLVKANQVIATLQGRDRAEQQLKEAQANVAVKQAQLKKIKQGEAKEGEIAAQRAAIAELEARLHTESQLKKAAIAEAEATVRKAQLKYERFVASTAAEQGAISRTELEASQEEFDRSTALLTQTRADLENTTSTLAAQITREKANLARLLEVRPVDVEIAKAELEQAIVQVEQRKAELDDTLVRVPITGQILKINTRVGERVNIEEGIAELGKTNQMYAIAEVYETDIVKVRLGQNAIITSEYGGFSGEIRGKVAQIGLQIATTTLNQDENNPTNDVNARIVEVKIRIAPKDSPKIATLTGMQVRVKIDVAS
jgi:HlyD family secretion protein